VNRHAAAFVAVIEHVGAIVGEHAGDRSGGKE
jgi:hypothetical protein